MSDQGPKAPEPESIKAQLQAARASKQQSTTVDLLVPGFKGRLGATYRALPWAETRLIGKAASKAAPDAANEELYVAADTLAKANVDTFAIIDGVKHPLGKRIGTALAGYLEMDVEGMTDRQAMFVLFARDTQLVAHYGELMEWQGGDADPKIDEELTRDFEVASS